MTKRPTKTKPFKVQDVIDWILDLRYFHPDDVIDGRTAIPFTRKNGDPDSRLVLVLGENAGGKSFFRRILQEVCRRPRNGSKGGPFPVREVIHLSMEGRCGGMFGGAAAFVYGAEDWQSTGENSAHTVKGGITTASGRDHDTVIYWDEPDLGMSAASAAGAGNAIRNFVDEEHEHVKAVFVTTHSPALVSQLLSGRHEPHYLYLGSEVGPPTPQDWIDRQLDLFYSPMISPEELAKLSHQRFRDISAILHDKKKGKRR